MVPIDFHTYHQAYQGLKTAEPYCGASHDFFEVVVERNTPVQRVKLMAVPFKWVITVECDPVPTTRDWRTDPDFVRDTALFGKLTRADGARGSTSGLNMVFVALPTPHRIDEDEYEVGFLVEAFKCIFHRSVNAQAMRDYFEQFQAIVREHETHIALPKAPNRDDFIEKDPYRRDLSFGPPVVRKPFHYRIDY